VQNIQVNSIGAPLNFTVNASVATNASGATYATPASIPVSAQGGPSLGMYVSNISITSGAQTVVVPVTTLITTGPATPPFLSSIVNAASQMPEAVAPGEILTIYGFGVGPSNAAGFTLNPAGNVATSLNGAQVLFDGNPAPMIYGSAYQANVIVPYEIAGHATTTIALQYGGVTSGGWSVPVVASAPGLFTIGATGVGQAAVLNQNGSLTRLETANSSSRTVDLGMPKGGAYIGFGAGMLWTTTMKTPLSMIDPTSLTLLCQWTGKGGDSLGIGFGAIWLTDYYAGTIARFSVAKTLQHCKTQ